MKQVRAAPHERMRKEALHKQVLKDEKTYLSKVPDDRWISYKEGVQVKPLHVVVECAGDKNGPKISNKNKSLAVIVDLLSSKNDDQDKAAAYFDRMKDLIKDGADVNLMVNKCFSPLAVAVIQGDVEMIRFLVDKGVNIDAIDEEGYTALHVGVLNAPPISILAILDVIKSADQDKISERINAQDKLGNTALNYAVVTNSSPLSSTLLLGEGADYAIRNNTGFHSRDVLHNTMNSSHLSYDKKTSLYFRLQVLDKNINRKTNDSGDVNSISAGLFDRMEGYLLLKSELERQTVAEKTLVNGYIKNTKNEIINIARNALNDFKEKEKTSATSSSSELKNIKIFNNPVATSLLESSFKLIYSITDFMQDNNLPMKAIAGYRDGLNELLELSKQLMQSGANIDKYTLFIAAQSDNADIARLVLDYDPRFINEVNEEDSNTALHYAKMCGSQGVVELLMQRGAKSDIPNKDGLVASEIEAVDLPSEQNIFGALKSLSNLNIGGDSNLPKPSASKKSTVKNKKEISLPPPKPPLDNLKKVMFDLQSSALSNYKKSDKTREMGLMLESLDKSEVSVNYTTTNDWTALHLACRFGAVSQVETLLSKGADVNLVTTSVKSSDQFTALRCAIESNNFDVVKLVLMSPNIDLNIVAKEVTNFSKNPALQTMLSTDKEVKMSLAVRIADIENGKERENLLSKISVSAKSKPASGKSSKKGQSAKSKGNNEANKSIRDLVNDIIRANKDIKNAESRRINKDIMVRKEISQAIDDSIDYALDEIERRNDLKSEAVNDFQDTLSNISEISQSDALRVVEEVKEKSSMIKGEVRGIVDVAMDEVQRREEESLEQERLEVVRRKTEMLQEAIVKAQNIQVKNFLKGPRNLDSIDEFPSFTQEMINSSLEDGHVALVKGSAAHPKTADNIRVPSDLDLEFWIDDLSKMSKEEILQLVEERYSSNAKVIITRESFGKPNFSVSIKDESRSLDISLYDPNNPPLSHLDWLTSKDRKVRINHDGIITKDVRTSRGLSKYLSTHPDLDLETDFFVNLVARDLVTRLCFMACVEHISQDDLNRARPIPVEAEASYNPTQLLYEELEIVKVKPGNDVIGEINKRVEGKISKVFSLHDLDKEHKLKFISCMNNIAQRDESGIYSSMRDALSLVYEKIENDIELKNSPSSPGNFKASSLKDSAVGKTDVLGF